MYSTELDVGKQRKFSRYICTIVGSLSEFEYHHGTYVFGFQLKSPKYDSFKVV